MEMDEIDSLMGKHFLYLISWGGDVPEMAAWFQARREAWKREPEAVGAKA